MVSDIAISPYWFLWKASVYVKTTVTKVLFKLLPIGSQYIGCLVENSVAASKGARNLDIITKFEGLNRQKIAHWWKSILIRVRKLSGILWLVCLRPYENGSSLLALPSLEKRRYIISVVFLVLSTRPSCYYRLTSLLSVDRLNFKAFSPFRLLCKNLDDIYNFISISDSLNTIKSILLNRRVLPTADLN